MALPSVAVHKSRGLRCARLAVTAWVGRRVASCRERLFGRRRLSLRKDARVSSAYLEARAIPVARSFKYGPQNGFGQREDGIQKVLLIPGGQTDRTEMSQAASACFCCRAAGHACRLSIGWSHSNGRPRAWALLILQVSVTRVRSEYVDTWVHDETCEGSAAR